MLLFQMLTIMGGRPAGLIANGTSDRLMVLLHVLIEIFVVLNNVHAYQTQMRGDHVLEQEFRVGEGLDAAVILALVNGVEVRVADP